MAAMFINLNIIEIGKLGLNLNEYMTLMKFQHDAEKRSFPFVPDERFFARLLADDFILETEEGYRLSEKGRRVFEGEDLFEEFYRTFPNKVPAGNSFRPVSTLDIESVSAKTTRAIWDRVTKHKPYLQRTIIDNLKKELAHRKSEGSLSYLHNIDTWLRQATWEKWNDIPNNKEQKSGGAYIKL